MVFVGSLDNVFYRYFFRREWAIFLVRVIGVFERFRIIFLVRIFVVYDGITSEYYFVFG